MKNTLKIFTLLAGTAIMGFTSCETIDECHDLSLIGQNPNEGSWMYYEPVCGCDQ